MKIQTQCFQAFSLRPNPLNTSFIKSLVLLHQKIAIVCKPEKLY